MSGQDPRNDSLKDKTEAFLSEFFTKGELLVRELIIENERLRTQLASTLQGRPAIPSVLPNAIERLMEKVNALEAECAEVRQMAGTVQRESGGYRHRLESLESEHYNLAAMYVAGNQFHAASSIEDVVQTITEILLNFVGLGRFTLFCVDEARQILFPLAREGGDVRECGEIVMAGEGAIAELAKRRTAWRPDDPRFDGPDVLMHLPLVSGTRLVGVARLESFLPQKRSFGDTDDNLLSLISEHSGIGIETAWIRAHARETPLQRQAIEHLVGA